MCYKKPGPRCAAYAKGQIKVAIKEQLEAERNEDFEKWEASLKKREDATFQYYMTASGQKTLERRIAAGRDVDANTALLEKARHARKEALAAIGIEKDEGKDVSFSHHDGKRDEKAPRQISFNPDEVRVNDTDFPHPQANRLDKVSTTVDAINGGATTASSIAQTLDVVDRQGYYYADAAGYLGLVEEARTGELKEYALTSLGQEFAQASPEEREKIIRDQVAGMPLMQIYQEEGPEAAKDFMQSSQNTGDSTVERRVATLNTWSRFLGSTNFSKLIADDQSAGQTRVISAAQYAEQQREKIKAKSTPAPVGETCQKCWLQKPLGAEQCPNCEA